MDKQNSVKVVNPQENPNWDSWLYRIGCPVWGCKEWSGTVYPKGTPSDQFLRWYSLSFPTVEGNSTFYAVPGPEVFEKWVEQSVPGFRFCFKFPRTISHEAKLKGCQRELQQWLERLDILRRGDRLGPTFLQLPPSFSPRSMETLASFLRELPNDWPWAVEVRHLDWFDAGKNELALDDLLQSLNIDRVLFDSRPLNSDAASDPTEVASQTRKPKSPFRTTVTGSRPMLRLIGRNNVAEVRGYWLEWAAQIATWIAQGLQPWVFTHAPDDRYAPVLVQEMHHLLRERVAGLASLCTPVANAIRETKPEYKQLELF